MSEENTLNRRNVLKQLGGAAAGSLAIASSGVASAEKPDLEERYAGRASLREAFRDHAADLPAALADAGVVSEEFDFEQVDFAVDPDATKVRPTDADGRAGVTVVAASGPRSALGMISTSTDDHDISLYVQPQREESYAFVEPKDDGDRFVVTDDGDEVTTLECTYKSCSCERCYNPDGVMYYYEEEYRCNTDCTDCFVEGTECICTSCS
ncbi:hypothetical protein NGM10_02290 [Halorussus salilacus]|uniref:hypothetical protein n=1 Tax=Halorussus salilacus TaxID=2953750 RepID=UPI00209DB9CF|nr:hypothetical protein [Halorussus salilacus]USZ68581.1 hypothetical protein NGM10_02290 [Halorussus salilacus]